MYAKDYVFVCVNPHSRVFSYWILERVKGRETHRKKHRYERQINWLLLALILTRTRDWACTSITCPDQNQTRTFQTMDQCSNPLSQSGQDKDYFQFLNNLLFYYSYTRGPGHEFVTLKGTVGSKATVGTRAGLGWPTLPAPIQPLLP